MQESVVIHARTAQSDNRLDRTIIDNKSSLFGSLLHAASRYDDKTPRNCKCLEITLKQGIMEVKKLQVLLSVADFLRSLCTFCDPSKSVRNANRR